MANHQTTVDKHTNKAIDLLDISGSFQNSSDSSEKSTEMSNEVMVDDELKLRAKSLESSLPSSESTSHAKDRSQTFAEASRAANKQAWNVISGKNLPSVKSGRLAPPSVNSVSHLLQLKSTTMSNSVDRDMLAMMSGDNERTYRLKAMGMMDSETDGTTGATNAVPRSMPDRGRTPSISEQYFGTSAEVGVLPHAYEANSMRLRNQTMQQSRRLPPWIWLLVSKMLGIRRHCQDIPVCGTILHIFTVTFAIFRIVTLTWYKIFDIKSTYSKETALSGCVNIIMTWFFSVLGIYGNLLARNLFLSPSFLDNVRLHSKTIVKLNTSVIMILLATTVVCLNDWQMFYLWPDEYCENIEVSPIVCKSAYVSHVAFSVFSLFWNLIVGITLLSVCRTHTIAIRRFIQELGLDAQACDYQRRMQKARMRLTDERPDLYDTAEDEEHFFVASQSHAFESRSFATQSTFQATPYDFPHNRPLDVNQPTRQQPMRYAPQSESSRDTHWMTNSHVEENTSQASASPMEGSELRQRNSEQNSPPRSILKLPSIALNDTVPLVDNEETNPEETSKEPENETEGAPATTSPNLLPPGLRVLTNDEILLSYWKISCRLRSTSIVLQRWLMAWIIFILLWSVTYIIYWVKHTATIEGLVEFIIPILILPIICSAYGEVNYEGTRLTRNICPIPERTYMLFYLTQNPLQMSAFGFSVSYSVLVTVLGALGVALCSRLILDEANM